MCRVAMTVLGLLSMIVLSGALFYPYYVKPTFTRWQLKNNPRFPQPATVKKEIIHMCKGLGVATLCPAFTLMASKWGMSQGYCGSGNGDTPSLFLQAAIIFFFTDLYEYVYHWLGHRFTALWGIHKHHHMFYNPTPFAVIADEYADQFVRTLPLVILPWVLPINMDLMFAIFATLFYGYGVYLHWGYESTWLTAHNPIFNTAYHHYTHHAISAKGRLQVVSYFAFYARKTNAPHYTIFFPRPIYTGFFFKIWDNVFDTTYPDGKCACFMCRPKRTESEWQKTEKPDYSVLLSPHWWLTSKCEIAAADVNKATD